ncbi:hypothetical protein EUZ85_25305 [Hahella sp. KA22]|uniref:HicB-like antitoxin of toxin-antitoxin system domain-containing protein n=1 Tax=Hahella chejuensis (strain KCTC 2396) TaxID=349521 RepID=Q2SLP8_HAHCH|nr:MULTISPECIES: hypothetical protein [Hahella]ABC28426.1 hypothetical protein HCH_01569 [Hahella chejuensis KCTC 2396]AZZ93854.1 hypothetical protein ENC22_22725 [Hahella sp. KA22]QAY57227.1 hypothetical protein EUZ85_25305 [Hahella sp. KA22]WLQ11703.1 hypothetical protein O5O45_18410 [Hahella sp. HNIBRBA332]
MTKLVFRVAVKQSEKADYFSSIPGLLVCGVGGTLEETLANTQLIIADYLKDSINAPVAAIADTKVTYTDVTWHIVEINRP